MQESTVGLDKCEIGPSKPLHSGGFDEFQYRLKFEYVLLEITWRGIRKKNLCVSFILYFHTLISFFNCMQISNDSIIHQNYHCALVHYVRPPPPQLSIILLYGLNY